MAHDPVVALVLWGLGFVGILAAAISLLVWHFPLEKMLPVLGGGVVLLGSYFAARTLRDGELWRATEMLGSDSLAVRLVGVHQLGQIGTGVPRFRKHSQLALRGFLADPSEARRDEASRRLARKVLDQLSGLEESTIKPLDVDVTDAFPALGTPGGASGSGAAPGS
jgi:hypothetical protein